MARPAPLLTLPSGPAANASTATVALTDFVTHRRDPAPPSTSRTDCGTAWNKMGPLVVAQLHARCVGTDNRVSAHLVTTFFFCAEFLRYPELSSWRRYRFFAVTPSSTRRLVSVTTGSICAALVVTKARSARVLDPGARRDRHVAIGRGFEEKGWAFPPGLEHAGLRVTLSRATTLSRAAPVTSVNKHAAIGLIHLFVEQL